MSRQKKQTSRELFNHHNPVSATYRTTGGLTEEVIRQISASKNEPEWMLAFRLRAFSAFQNMPLPSWGPDLSPLDFQSLTYYLEPNARKNATRWEDVPADIKRTFERLGIPEAEQKYLAGAGAQYESSVIYHNLKKQWEDLGVVFIDFDVAVHEQPELV
jgi:Fe-S cluster assembly protein SufB